MESILPALSLLGVFGLLIAINFSEVSANRKKMKQIERKIDILLEKQGISVNSEAFIPLDVLEALKNNQKIKAIRLYRQQTGSSILEAQKAINYYLGSKA
ncbi:hypothetical protein JQC92_15815 [Shewanella sp. 202IG2-18]|uniref:hypothetical protein n=1 Tax=Parashewanella hymeniacidonis TaxID=2807618 RepID=UPI00196136A4|nr:hypothetical protein [Parashewanella hymeniacidonis]MBM7073481.1 hypothetical protein [Parashewanella hymeniacidonis]